MSEEENTDLPLDEAPEAGDLDTDATPEAEDAEGADNEDSSTSEDGDDSAEQPPKKRGVGKRIDELTRQRYEAQREAEYWRDKALGYLEGKPKQPEPSSDLPKAPNPLNFDSDDDYQQALDQYIEQRSQSVLTRREREAEEARQRQEQEALQQTWQERVNQYADEKDDFYQVTQDPSLPVTQDMADAIMSADNGPDVLYWLGKNPQEAARIANLKPVAAAREIGRIEARLSAPPPKKTTKAPDPVKPIGGNDPGVTDPDKLPMDEWVKYERQRLAKKYGG